MRFHVRPLLALAAAVALNVATHDSLGYYELYSFIGVMIAFVAALSAALMPDVIRNPAAPLDGDLMALALVAVTAVMRGVPSVYVTFLDVPWALDVARVCALGGAAACLAGLLRPPWQALFGSIDLRPFGKLVAAGVALGLLTLAVRFALGLKQPSVRTAGAFVAAYIAGALVYMRRRILARPESPRGSWGLVVCLAFALLFGIAMRGFILAASPDPVIDVFALMRDGTDHLLAGRNLYTADIVSPYGTPRAVAELIKEPPDPRPAGYPPHPYVITAPFRAAGLDPRWADVAGDAVAAFALFAVGRQRGRPRAGFLAAVTFLFLPNTTVMIESAWYEPMIAALLGVGLWLVELPGARRWYGYLALGWALTAKQYGLPLLPVVTWSHRRDWRLLLLGLFAGAVVMLPWLLWSPPDFLDTVLWKHLDRPSQHARAMTIAAACYRAADRVPPREVLWGIATILIGVISWRTPGPGAKAAVGIGTALFVFSLFHTQGFFNYFHLTQYLLLLGSIGLLTREEAS